MLEYAGVSEELHKIAAILEERVGLSPASSIVADTNLAARLRRVREAFDDWADSVDTGIDTMSLPDLTDVDSSLSPTSRQFLGYDGSEWTALTPLFTDLGDTQTLGEHDNVNDLVDSDLAYEGVLVYSTVTKEWAPDYITSLQITDIDSAPGDESHVLASYTTPGNHWKSTLFSTFFANQHISHTVLTDIGTNTHAQIDIHIGDSTTHFTEASIDHTAIQNIGTLTHAEIDAWLDQDVTSGSSPMFDGTNFTGIPDGALDESYILANGTRALTAAWDAGDYRITANSFSAGSTPGNENFTTVDIVTSPTYTDSFPSVYTNCGLCLDYNYTYNNAAGIDSNTVYGLNIDMDLSSNTVGFIGTSALLHATLDVSGMALSQASGKQPVYLKTTTTTTNQTFGSGAAFLGVDIQALTSGVVIGTRSYGKMGGSGNLLAYQGWAEAATYSSTAFSGTLTGLEGFTAGAAASASSIYGVSSQPCASGTAPAADRVLAYWSNRGHWMCGGGSLAVLQSNAANLTGVSPTHVAFTGTAGQAYIQNNLEVDGTIYSDGDLTIAAQKMLTIGVYSDATRPAAGTAGRMIFNTTDGNLNIDDGTNWILPDGSTT